MIALIVFYIHIIGVVAGFTKRWQDDGPGEGFLTLFFMGLIFFVGWSMSSFIAKLLMGPEGLGIFFDRDAASLVLLTAMEAVFYTLYLRKGTSESEGPGKPTLLHE